MLPGVSKTAILTLRARVDEHARPDRIFADPLAATWWAQVTWPPELDRWYGPDAQAALAFRAHDIDHILRRFAGGVSSLAVVELGAGLSTRRDRLCDLPGLTAWYDLDLPEVSALRQSWGAPGEQLAASVLDHRWMDRLEGDPSAFFFIAEGLLYYLPRAEVDALFLELGRRFPGSVVLLDVVGANDAPKLRANGEAVGAPIQWTYAGDFASALETFGLSPVPEFELDRLMLDALDRYWSRIDEKTRGLIYFAMHNELIWARRSGMVLGRLPPR